MPHRTPPRTPERPIKLPAHPRPLRPLPGKHETRSWRPPADPGHHRPGLLPAATAPSPASSSSRSPPGTTARCSSTDRIATSEYPTATGSSPGPAAANAANRAACARSAASPRPDTSHGTTPPATTGAAPRPPGAPRPARPGASSMITCAFVPLIPNDDTPARRGRPPPATPAAPPAAPPPRRPVHLRRRPIHMQRHRQHPMPQRQHHLDHPGHPRRRLRMTDIRLHRPQPQRPPRRPPPPVHRQQRLRLNRITQPRPRPMPLHHIHLPRHHPRSRQRPRITRCCDGPFGAVSPLLAPS